MTAYSQVGAPSKLRREPAARLAHAQRTALPGAGKFLFRMGDAEVVMEAGDMLDVPAGEASTGLYARPPTSSSAPGLQGWAMLAAQVHYAKVLQGPCTFIDGSKR